MHNSCSLGVPMTDTKILACCKSADTSARVTVTFLTRGSCNSNRMVSLATSRITSATRAKRCVFMVVPQVRTDKTVRATAPWAGHSCPAWSNFHLVVEQLRHGVRAQGLHYLPQRHL